MILKVKQAHSSYYGSAEVGDLVEFTEGEAQHQLEVFPARWARAKESVVSRNGSNRR